MPVAPNATPSRGKLSRQEMKQAKNARSVLLLLHREYKSWRAIADEIGQNKGTLSGVAAGKRPASHELITRLNEVYGCRIPLTETVTVEVCSRCEQPHPPRKACPRVKTGVKTPKISWKRLSLWLMAYLVSQDRVSK